MYKYTELIYFLSALYYKQEDIIDIIIKSGNQSYLAFIPMSPKATVYWTNVVSYYEEKRKIKLLVTTVINDGHADNDYLKSFLENEDTEFKSPYSNRSLGTQNPIESKELEKLTKGKSTLLPISFLEKGLDKARSVVRVVTKKSLGTGFLLKNNYFITNNHVIDSKETAAGGKIQLNYQNTMAGALSLVENIELDPFTENGFATSKENDWTVVKLKGFTDKLIEDFGFLDLREIKIQKDDFVNIIQHPGGEAKQIALYHNLIVGFDNERVQYLTDTQPGSSGSPVFNTDWDVVALHHAGGELIIKGTNKKELVNEGININLVIKEIRQQGIEI